MPTDLAPPPNTPAEEQSPDQFIAALEATGDFGGSSTPEPEPKAAEPTPAPAAPPPAAAPTTPPRQPDGKFTKPTTETKPAPKPPEVPAGPKELRQQYETTKAERDALKAEKDTLAKESAELKAKITAAEQAGKATGALEAKLAAIEKEKDELRGELAKHRFEASDDFKKNFETPWQQAAGETVEFLEGLDKSDGTGKGGIDDLTALYRLPYQQALAQAGEMFGENVAAAVMGEVRRVQALDRAKSKALESEKSGWAEKSKMEEGRKAQEREATKQTWQKVNTELRDTVEDYRDPVDDTEAADVRKKMYGILDAPTKTPHDQLVKNAHIRHRAAAFEVQKLHLTRAKTRIADLEKQLAATKHGQPNPDGRKAGGAEVETEEKSWEEEAMKIKKLG